MPKCFDVPFNFDESFIYIIENIRFQKYKINSYYIYPFPEDYEMTDLTSTITIPSTREEYEHWLIKYFKANVDLNLFKMQLILENPDTIMDKDTLKYYLNFGFSQFSCSSIEQAQTIKEVYPEAEIIGSIFMDISSEKLEQHPEYKDYFNKFVLPFSYNRNIDAIKLLPDTYEYIIIPNANLQIDDDLTKENFTSLRDLNQLVDEETYLNSAKIRPVDIIYFSKYIHQFRLQHSDWTTTWILQELIAYSYLYENYPNIEYNKFIYGESNIDD